MHSARWIAVVEFTEHVFFNRIAMAFNVLKKNRERKYVQKIEHAYLSSLYVLL